MNARQPSAIWNNDAFKLLILRIMLASLVTILAMITLNYVMLLLLMSINIDQKFKK